MRKSLVSGLVLAVFAFALAGCSDGRSVATPPACLTVPATWITALSKAPDQVFLNDSTPISACIPEKQGAAQQQEVGNSAVDTATQLAAYFKGKGGTSGTDSTEQAALMAGYLVGALEKGAETSDGIHATLVQRVEAAATNGLEGASQQVQGAYQRGHEAGLKSG